MSTDSSISVITDEGARIVGAAGPGLVDIHINGYAGIDFNGPIEQLTVENVGKACRAMRKRGVVTILATIITDSAANMIAHVEQIARLRKQDELLDAMIAGFHIEGPMISNEDGPRGAHMLECVTAPADAPGLLDDLQAACEGMVRLLTLAPELPGAMELIARAVSGGVVVSLGHHNADAETIAEAVAAGAKMCTHLGNGSHAVVPRLDNYIQHQLADDRLAASFIADGQHIPFPTLKNFIRAKQPHRSILITDAISATEMPPGRYAVGNITCLIGPDGISRLEGTPYLAGSTLTLDKAVLNVYQHCDVPFKTAWAMASTQPAELVGLAAPEKIEVDITDEGFARH